MSDYIREVLIILVLIWTCLGFFIFFDNSWYMAQRTYKLLIVTFICGPLMWSCFIVVALGLICGYLSQKSSIQSPIQAIRNMWDNFNIWVKS
jgi:hypothetical protein